MSENTKRIPNFSPEEKQCLMRILYKYSDIIEAKKTNKVSAEEKSKAWKQTADEFNSTGPALCFRTTEQLKRLYENKKKELRKKLAENKQQVYLTDGGPPPEDVKLDDADKILLQIINEKTVYGMTSKFDSDAVGPPAKMKKQDDCEEFEYCPIENENEVEIFDLPDVPEVLLTHRCPPTGLQGAINKKLKRGSSSQIINQPSKKISATMANSIASNINITTPKTALSERRRPMSRVRVLTSSDVAEKYNLLLDKRLTLLEKQLQQIQEVQQYASEENKMKMTLLKQQEENLCLEKQEKLLKIELLKTQLRVEKSLLPTST